MNIFVLIVLLYLQDIPTLPEAPRANRRANRDKAIARNRRIYNNKYGKGKWYDIPYHDEIHDRVKHPKQEGFYTSYHCGQIHSKPQHGRWATDKIGGHRRFMKWEKDYYGSPEVALDKYFRKIDERYELNDPEN